MRHQSLVCLLAAAIILTPANPVHAQDLDRAVGALIGAIIGGAIQGQQRQQQQTTRQQPQRAQPARPTISQAQRQATREVQTALNFFDFPAGTADGIMGPNTRSAIRAYQTAMGYPVTGSLEAAQRDFLLGSYRRARNASADHRDRGILEQQGSQSLLRFYRDELNPISIWESPLQAMQQPASVARNAFWVPERGSPERAEILDALRPEAEQTYGSPVEFMVDYIHVSEDRAHVSVTAQRPGGGAIILRETPGFKRGEIFLDERGELVSGAPGDAQALLQRTSDGWEVTAWVYHASEAWQIDHCKEWSTVLPDFCPQSGVKIAPPTAVSRPSQLAGNALIENNLDNVSGRMRSKFGPLAIVDDDSELMNCFRDESHSELQSCMRNLGVRDEAVEFSEALKKIGTQGYLTGYLLRGEVDIGRVYLPNMANTNEQYVLLNGRDGIIMPYAEVPRARPSDAASRALQSRFPNAMMTGRLFPIGYRDLPDGGQRFVFTDILTDGCRGCEVVGSAILFLDFVNGVLRNTEIVGWKGLVRDNNLPSRDYALSREVAGRILGGDVQEMQTQLNLKGFQAGGMDGVLGPQTEGALTEFLAENCLPGPDNLTAEGVNRLSLQLGDIEEGVAAAGDLKADTLFTALDAMHQTLQPCGPPKATLMQYHPDLAHNLVGNVSENVSSMPPRLIENDDPERVRTAEEFEKHDNTGTLTALIVKAGYFDTDSGESNGQRRLGVELSAKAGTIFRSPVSAIVMGNRSGADVPAAEKWLILRDQATGREHIFGGINSPLEPGQSIQEGDVLGEVTDGGDGNRIHWGINRLGVWQAVDTASGWGWDHGPATASAEQAQARGWIDPSEHFQFRAAEAPESSGSTTAVETPSNISVTIPAEEQDNQSADVKVVESNEESKADELSLVEQYFTSAFGVDSDYVQLQLIDAGFYSGDLAPFEPNGRHSQWTPKVRDAFQKALDYARSQGIAYDLSNEMGYYAFVSKVRAHHLDTASAMTSSE